MKTKATVLTNVDHAMADIVNAFLKWPLPTSVCSDRCVTMAGERHRSGTNLLNCPEAVSMAQEVVRPIVERLLSERPICRACEIFDDGPCSPKAFAKMQDKVARAIHAEHNRHEGQTTPWMSLHKFQQSKYRGKAYAALVALGLPAPTPDAPSAVSSTSKGPAKP